MNEPHLLSLTESTEDTENCLLWLSVRKKEPIDPASPAGSPSRSAVRRSRAARTAAYSPSSLTVRSTASL